MDALSLVGRLKENTVAAVRFTIVTTIVFGVGYPLAVTGLSQWLFPRQANGSLIVKDGQVIGSRLLGQAFSSDKYFHPRPSAAGNGYDATASAGSNLGPTNRNLVARVEQDVEGWKQVNPGTAIPVDLVTASGSGLDPDISPANAEFQLPRVAKARGMSEEELRAVIARHTKGRDWSIFGEPRVNVLELNLDLDGIAAK